MLFVSDSLGPMFNPSRANMYLNHTIVLYRSPCLGRWPSRPAARWRRHCRRGRGRGGGLPLRREAA